MYNLERHCQRTSDAPTKRDKDPYMTEAGEIKHMKFARQSSDGGAPQSNDEALQYPENTVFGTGRYHNSTGLSACPY